MNTITRRAALQSLGAACTLFPALTTRAANPDVVRVVCGFPPGGTADVVARRVSERLPATGYARTTSLVDNRAGAGGRLAVENVKNSVADGASLLLTPHSVLTIYPSIYSKLSYDPFADLTPVSLAATFSHALAVGPVVPGEVTTLQGFLAWAKAHPELASYGSPAAGSIPHFIGALLAKHGGVELRHIPYRGSMPGVNDAVGGQVAAMITPVGDFLPYSRAGKLRILATSGSRRTPFTPNVATFSEQGQGAINFDEWYGLYAPAKTPATTVSAANAAIGKALQERAVVDGLATFGLVVGGSTPEDLGRMTRQEFTRWGPIVKEIGFTADS